MIRSIPKQAETFKLTKTDSNSCLPLSRLFCCLAITFFLLCSGFAFCSSKIMECDSLRTMYELADENTLCVLDIDNTLYRPRQMLGSDEWITYCIKKSNSLEEIENIVNLWHAIHIVTEIDPMEPGTSDIVRRLQSKCSVMAMTNRQPSQEITTKNQLRTIHIDMQLSSPITSSFNLKQLPLARFSAGVLYTANQHKGKSLQEFLEITKLEPKRIIYINDHKNPLTEVAGLLPEEIEFTGLRFTGADKFVTTFDPLVAEYELKSWKNILGDDKARKILAKKAG